MRIDSRDIEQSIDDENLKATMGQLTLRELEALKMMEEMEIHRIKGDLTFAVPASSFDRNKDLFEIYPKDEEGWRWIRIEPRDATFTNISDQANELLLEQAGNTIRRILAR